MYKEVSIFKTENSKGEVMNWMKEFNTESDYKDWETERGLQGWTIVGEKCIVEPYPQVLRLDLKSHGNHYFTIIERFETSKEYKYYCEYKLMEGFKVIGSTPLFK